MPHPVHPDFSLTRRQQERHDGVERQGLALGAAHERARLAACTLHDREIQSAFALDGWENEGGRTARIAPRSSSGAIPKLTTLQWSADLFRDDTVIRAVIINGLLLLIAAIFVIAVLNN
ncbi:MAG TPA: hypothetical protein VJM09_05435 [Sphingobium sp.]|nr:hypothetical protein [Sphingobium sp.]